MNEQADRLLARLAELEKERDEATQKAREATALRISQGNDLIRQRDEARKDQIEIRELLNCTEDDDDYIGALRLVIEERNAYRSRFSVAEHRESVMIRCLECGQDRMGHPSSPQPPGRYTRFGTCLTCAAKVAP